jgi:adenosylcobyric acid synthase
MRAVMIQGTSSDAGKTTIVTGLCRLFSNRGFRVAPFKSQNMALNSFVTKDNREIARATATQAMAARQEPSVHMNPLLLKPKADDIAQLIVHGLSVGDVSARDYFMSDKLQPTKLAAIRESIAYLKQNFDLIVAEGAGSCAEPNLRALDVVNMGVAHELGAKVLIVSDLANGGAFASLLGSIEVMRQTNPEDLGLIGGFILNKFRGDSAVLAPGLEFIARATRYPVVGVLPYLNDLRFEEEDRVKDYGCDHPEIDIAVIYLPHISNANDFDFLAAEKNVQVRFVKSVEALGLPDAIIIPGTKNTPWDLTYLRGSGLAVKIEEMSASIPVVGICGGFEMLGRKLLDPLHVESDLGTTEGLNLLDVDVEFVRDKTLVNREYEPDSNSLFASVGTVSGYEIHCGIVRRRNCTPLFRYDGGSDGAIHPEKLIFGTFIHDLFKNDRFTRTFINLLREKRGLRPLEGPFPRLRDIIDENCDTFAHILADNLSPDSLALGTL